MAKFLVITGGSKGIGFATCQLFKENGWEVINISRHACEIDGVTSIACDFSEANWQTPLKQSLLPLIASSEQTVLVHNAAMYLNGDVQTLDTDAFKRSFDVNVLAPIELNQLLFPSLNAGDSIIYIGSTLSEKAVKGAAPYVISKHALLGLMRSTCQDFDDTGIHTCCICPGFTNTEMLQSHLHNDPDIIKAITAHVSARRLIEPEEIAELVLLSADNPVMNGAVLHANLGQIER